MPRKDVISIVGLPRQAGSSASAAAGAAVAMASIFSVLASKHERQSHANARVARGLSFLHPTGGVGDYTIKGLGEYPSRRDVPPAIIYRR